VSADLRALVVELQKRIGYLERVTGYFVDEASLDGPNGDPVVKFPSKKWQGPDFTGKRFSECSPAFLVSHAEWLAWKSAHPKAGKDPKYAAFDLVDAARARTWARRLARANGRAGPAPVAPKPWELDDEPEGEPPSRPMRDEDAEPVLDLRFV
jgi:hypothetical protein